MAEEGQTPEESLAQVNSVTNLASLQEIRFWVTIMKELALFIRFGLALRSNRFNCTQAKLLRSS